MTDPWRTLKNWLNGKPPILPEGCLLDVELDPKDMPREFLPRGRNAAIEGYRAIRDDLRRRPTMLEVFSRGFLPRTICAAEGSWFQFAESEGDLTEEEQAVVFEFSDWLAMLESTVLNKSYKMVQVNTHLDPEDGGRYTIKRYHSTKRIDEEGWTHQTIELQPLNPDPKYRPIPITEDDAESIRVVGEFVAVLGD